MRRSIVDMLINPATSAAAELDIEAARLGGIMITAHDKARCEMIEAYDVKNAQNKKARRVELKQNAAALKAKYASVAMVEEHARIMELEEAEVKQQFGKWKVSFKFEDEHGQRWAEKLGNRLRDAGVEKEEATAFVGDFTFKRKLVVGEKDAAKTKDRGKYDRWLLKKRCQLSALLDITAVSRAMALAASAARKASESADPNPAEFDSDSDGEDDEEESDEVSDALQKMHADTLECFIGIGGSRETHVRYTGQSTGQQYYLYVPPGGGKKMRSWKEVQKYLDAPVEYSRTSDGLSRPLAVVTGPEGERRGAASGSRT